MAAPTVTPSLHSNIGCYILAHLLCHNLETTLTCLLDSGAQTWGLLPFHCLPPLLHSRLEMGRRLTGISGSELPVAGSLSLLLTVGKLSKWVNFIVMKEHFEMSHPILGYTFLKEFNISINFATRTILANKEIIMSQFIDHDNIAVQRISQIINTINSTIDNPHCHSMLHFIASKLSYVHSWLSHSAQFASSSTFSLETETDLILNNTLPCIKRMFARHGEHISDSVDELKNIHQTHFLASQNTGFGEQSYLSDSKYGNLDQRVFAVHNALKSSAPPSAQASGITLLSREADRSQGYGPQLTEKLGYGPQLSEKLGYGPHLSEKLGYGPQITGKLGYGPQSTETEQLGCGPNSKEKVSIGYRPSQTNVTQGSRPHFIEKCEITSNLMESAACASSQIFPHETQQGAPSITPAVHAVAHLTRPSSCVSNHLTTQTSQVQRCPVRDSDVLLNSPDSNIACLEASTALGANACAPWLLPVSILKQTNSLAPSHQQPMTQIHDNDFGPEWPPLIWTVRQAAGLLPPPTPIEGPPNYCDIAPPEDAQLSNARKHNASLSRSSSISDSIPSKSSSTYNVSLHSDTPHFTTPNDFNHAERINYDSAHILLNTESIDVPSHKISPTILSESFIAFKRFRCNECQEKLSTEPDSSISLSTFCAINTIKIMPKTVKSVDVFLQSADDSHIHMGDRHLIMEQEIIDNSVLANDSIAESRFGNRHKILLTNYSNDTVVIPKDTKLGTAIRFAQNFNKPILPDVLNAEPSEPLLTPEERIKIIKSKVSLDHMPPEHRPALEELLSTYHDVFYCQSSDFQVAKGFEYKIHLKSGATGAYSPQFRLTKADTQEVHKIILDMLKKKQISPCPYNKKFNSPVFLLRKQQPDGSVKLRFLFDARKLNAIIDTAQTTSHYDLVPETLFTLADKSLFTTLDVASAFMHLKLSEESRPLVSFTFQGQQYMFNVLIFGLNIAPGAWLGYFENLMRHLTTTRNISIYMDDGIISGLITNYPEQIETIQLIFQVLRDNNLRISAEKFMPCHESLNYLGYIVSADGITIAQDKIDPIMRIDRPHNIKSLQRFLGVISYYSNFCANAAPYLSLLTPLLNKKNRSFIWSHDQHAAFLELKRQLMMPPVLQFPNYNKVPVLFADASLSYCSAILCYAHEDTYLPVSYFSKKISPAKRYYSIMTLELLAIVLALKHFKYLIPHRRLIVKTDNKNLCGDIKIENDARMAKMALFISTFDLTIEHLSSEKNFLADYLSRAERIPSEEILRLRDQYEPLLSIKQTLRLVDPHSTAQCQPHIDAEEIRCAQENDPYVTRLQAAIAENPALLSLYKYNHQGLLFISDDTLPDRLILPKASVNHILYLYHNLPFAGHVSAERLYLLLRMKYFFVGLKAAAENYVRECMICQRVKKSPHLKHTKYEIVRHPSAPGKMIATDICLVGRKASKNNYIGFILIIDLFTNYIYARPIRRQTAMETAQKLNKYFLTMGCPSICLSDGGTNYQAALIKNLCQLMNVKKITSCSFYSRGNAAAENAIRRTTYVLRTLVEQSQGDWTDLLLMACANLNGNVCSSTGNTPFFLTHMRDFRYCFESYLLDQSPDYLSTEEFLAATLAKYKTTMDTVIACADKRDQRNKDYHDKNAKDQSYALGELVWLYKPALPDQLKNKVHNRRYCGPFRITKIINTNCYEVTDLVKFITQTVNIHRLKPYRGQLIWAGTNFSSDSDTDSESEYHDAVHLPSAKNSTIGSFPKATLSNSINQQRELPSIASQCSGSSQWDGELPLTAHVDQGAALTFLSGAPLQDAVPNFPPSHNSLAKNTILEQRVPLSSDIANSLLQETNDAHASRSLSPASHLIPPDNNSLYNNISAPAADENISLPSHNSGSHGSLEAAATEHSQSASAENAPDTGRPVRNRRPPNRLSPKPYLKTYD